MHQWHGLGRIHFSMVRRALRVGRWKSKLEAQHYKTTLMARRRSSKWIYCSHQWKSSMGWFPTRNLEWWEQQRQKPLKWTWKTRWLKSYNVWWMAQKSKHYHDFVASWVWNVRDHRRGSNRCSFVIVHRLLLLRLHQKQAQSRSEISNLTCPSWTGNRPWYRDERHKRP